MNEEHPQNQQPLPSPGVAELQPVPLQVTLGIQPPVSEPVKKKRFPLAAAFFVLMIGAGVIVYALLGVANVGQTHEQLEYEVVKNEYRVVRQQAPEGTLSRNGADVLYALIGPDDVIINNWVANSNLSLITELGDDSLLFRLDGDDYYANDYFIASADGFREVSDPPDSLGYDINRSPKGANNIFGISGRSVAYNYCPRSSSSASLVSCDFRVYKFDTEEERIIQLPQQAEHNSRLVNVSPDKRYVYLLGSKLTPRGGDSILDHHVIIYDLEEDKVHTTYSFETESTYYGKFWLSPNGKDIVYSNGGEKGSIQRIDITTGDVSTINLPDKTVSSEPFGGRTVSHDPLYSASGNFIGFVSYRSTADGLIPMVGVINLSTGESKEIDLKGGPVLKGVEYEDLRWVGDDTFEFNDGTTSYRYYVETDKIGVFTLNGMLTLGVEDGIR